MACLGVELSVANSQVIQNYDRNDQQADDVVDQDEADTNKELSDLFKKWASLRPLRKLRYDHIAKPTLLY